MFNIALIGYGYWGPNIANNIFESRMTRLVSICDLKQARLDTAKLKFQNQTTYTNDYHEYLLRDDIHAVAIAVETEAHFRIAKEFIQAGKHVFIEKPMTPSVQEAEELIELALRHKVHIHVDHIMVFHPAIRKIKELLDSGDLGDLIYFDSSRMNLGKIKNDVSAMWDLAVHDLAIIDFLIGGKEPGLITVMGEKFWSTKESLTFLNIKYNKFIAHLKSSWISPVKERRMIIAGTKKMVVFDDMKSEKMIIYNKGFDFENQYVGIDYSSYALKVREGDAFIPNLNFEDALRNSIEHFVVSVQNNSPSMSGPDQALRVIKILEKADELLKKENND